MKRWALLLAVVLAAPAAFAQDREVARDDGSDAGVQVRKTIIDFDEDLIEGDLKGPDLGMTAVKRLGCTPRRLIRIRTDFRNEVMRSASDL